MSGNKRHSSLVWQHIVGQGAKSDGRHKTYINTAFILNKLNKKLKRIK